MWKFGMHILPSPLRLEERDSGDEVSVKSKLKTCLAVKSESVVNRTNKKERNIDARIHQRDREREKRESNKHGIRRKNPVRTQWRTIYYRIPWFQYGNGIYVYLTTSVGMEEGGRKLAAAATYQKKNKIPFPLSQFNISNEGLLTILPSR